MSKLDHDKDEQEAQIIGTDLEKQNTDVDNDKNVNTDNANTNTNTNNDPNYGLCEFVNMGNTCYLNSILQCLLATKKLAYFFIDVDTMIKTSELKQKCIEKIEEIKGTAQNKDLSKEDYNNIILQIAKENGHEINKKNTKELIKRLLTNKLNEGKLKFPDVSYTIVFQLYRIFEKVYESNCNIKPTSMKKIITVYNEDFRHNNQQDSHELVNLLLDKMNDELCIKKKSQYNNIPEEIKYIYLHDEDDEDDKKIIDEYKQDNPYEYMACSAYKYLEKFVSNSYSIISTSFCGLYCNMIKCDVCKNLSYSFEPFTTFNVEITDDTNTLKDCIDNFSKEEILEGDNQYHCDKCKDKVNAKKKIFIWEPPHVLIITLKRFMNDGSGNKNSKMVEYPLENLEIKSGYEKEEIIHNYDLYAVCWHRGNLAGGHYKAYCKHIINDKWYEFDDDDVFEIHDENDVIDRSGYVLFYERN